MPEQRKAKHKADATRKATHRMRPACPLCGVPCRPTKQGHFTLACGHTLDQVWDADVDRMGLGR